LDFKKTSTGFTDLGLLVFLGSWFFRFLRTWTVVSKKNWIKRKLIDTGFYLVSLILDIGITVFEAVGFSWIWILLIW